MKTFQADKNWIRIAFCVLLVIDYNAVKALDSNSLTEQEADVVWSKFVKVLNNTMKSRKESIDFAEKLLIHRKTLVEYSSLSNNTAGESSFDWKKLSGVYYSDSFSVGKSKSSFASLNEALRDPTSQHFTTTTTSFIKHSRVNEAMDCFSVYFAQIISDNKLVSSIGPQQLPFLPILQTVHTPPVLSTRRRLAYNDYFAICADITTTSRIEYVLSMLPDQPECSIGNSDNHLSILDHLFSPTMPPDGIESKNVIQSKLKDYLYIVKESIFSGILSVNKQDAKEKSTKHRSSELSFDTHSEHTSRENPVDLLEKPVCILLKYNYVFGFSNFNLHRSLLPLCAMGLWKAAKQILKLIENDRINCKENDYAEIGSNHLLQRTNYNTMCFILHNELDKLQGNKLLEVYEQHIYHSIFRSDQSKHEFVHHCGNSNETDSWNGVNLEEMTVVTPLHFAIRSSDTEFIENFFKVFPDFPVDLQTILQFAVAIDSAHICTTILAATAQFQSSTIATNRNYIFNFARINAQNLIVYKKNNQQVHFPEVQRLSRCVEMTTQTALLFSLKCHMKSALNCFFPYILAPPSSSKSDSDSGSSLIPKNSVLMLNGSSMDFQEFLGGNHFTIAMTATCPVLTGGYYSTGHTLQHELLGNSSDDNDDRLNTMSVGGKEWRSQILAVNFLGCSPLYNALRTGSFLLADAGLSAVSVARVQSEAPQKESSSFTDIDEDAETGVDNILTVHTSQTLQSFGPQFKNGVINSIIRQKVVNELIHSEMQCKFTRAMREGNVPLFAHIKSRLPLIFCLSY